MPSHPPSLAASPVSRSFSGGAPARERAALSSAPLSSLVPLCTVLSQPQPPRAVGKGLPAQRNSVSCFAPRRHPSHLEGRAVRLSFMHTHTVTECDVDGALVVGGKQKEQRQRDRGTVRETVKNKCGRGLAAIHFCCREDQLWGLHSIACVPWSVIEMRQLAWSCVAEERLAISWAGPLTVTTIYHIGSVYRSVRALTFRLATCLCCSPERCVPPPAVASSVQCL